jgi:hypothetical protein
MTVKPRTRTQDERFLKGARAFGEVGAEVFTAGEGFGLAFFAFILVYIFVKAIWGLIQTLREAKKPEKTQPEKKQRVSTTPTHYPK